MEVIEAQRYGLYHLSNSGACSRYELAVQAAEFAALDPSRVIGKPVSENGPHRSAAEILVMEHDGAAGSRLGPAAALAGNVGRVRSELTKADSSLRSE